MSFFDSLFGRSMDDPRKKFVESVDLLERFARDLMSGFERLVVADGTPAKELFRPTDSGPLLFEAETSAREVLHAYIFGASAESDLIGPGQGMEIWVELNSRLFGCSPDEARRWADPFISGECGMSDGDWRLENQKMHEENRRMFDVLSITLRNGQKRTFYFDITNFFAK